MIHVGHMNYFNVNECGLYKTGSNKNHGCSLSETFHLIKDWRKDKQLATTIPWDITGQKNSKAKCYCKDIYKDETTGDFLIVLWKSDTDGNGTLWGAQEDSTEGNDGVIEYTNQHKGKKVIWGRPCYYWVITDHNTVVSIKFEHSVCDTNLFQDWLIGCINYKVEHPNRKKESTEKGFIKLSYISPTENTPNRLSYRFDLSLKSLNTSKSELSKLATKITHIIKRETIVIDPAKDERADWLKKFSSILPEYVSPKPQTKKRQVELKIEAKPTPMEIKELIEKYAIENRKQADWDNVGFQNENGTTTWVDRYRLKDSIAVSQEKSSTFSASFLYGKILEQRQKFIKPLLEEETAQEAIK